ncbi:MAG TPA: hypothetical protein VFE17_06395 [Candidatus Baltobacteraceae bacterium]|nr:hypothetical protein [Candidatus Baltobacteraceae bacterium]
MKHPYAPAHSTEFLPKDLRFRRTARVRERAESLALLAAMAGFWIIVFTLNFFVGAFSTPMLR